MRREQAAMFSAKDMEVNGGKIKVKKKKRLICSFFIISDSSLTC